MIPKLLAFSTDLKLNNRTRRYSSNGADYEKLPLSNTSRDSQMIMRDLADTSDDKYQEATQSVFQKLS